MPALTIDNLVTFLVFVLPGFVALKVYDLFVPSARRNFSESLIDVVAYSLLNLLVVAIPLLQITSSDRTIPYHEEHPERYVAWLVVLLFVSPAVLAFLTYLMRMRVLSKWISHPMPTAWTWFFARRSNCWVVARLKSGTMIGGFFGAGSYASVHPHDPQLFIRHVWKVDQKGQLVEPSLQSLGILIRLGDCDYLEFKSPE